MGTVHVVWQRVGDEPHAADALLRSTTAHLLGRRPDQVTTGRRCESCGSEDHGRPFVRVPDAEAPHVSLARAAGVVVVALSADIPIGVDVERLDQPWPEGTTDLLLHPQERPRAPDELTRLWVRKEALLKASGDGLLVEPSRLRLDDSSARVLEWPGGPAVVALADVVVDEWAVCVAVLDAQDPKVEVGQATSGSGGRSVSSSQAVNRPSRS